MTGAQIRSDGMTQLAVSGASGKTGWRVVEEARKEETVIEASKEDAVATVTQAVIVQPKRKRG